MNFWMRSVRAASASFNFVPHVAYARSVFDDAECGSLVRVASGIAGDGYDAISHIHFEIVERDPIPYAVATPFLNCSSRVGPRYFLSAAT